MSQSSNKIDLMVRRCSSMIRAYWNATCLILITAAVSLYKTKVSSEYIKKINYNVTWIWYDLKEWKDLKCLTAGASRYTSNTVIADNFVKTLRCLEEAQRSVVYKTSGLYLPSHSICSGSFFKCCVRALKDERFNSSSIGLIYRLGCANND